MIEKNIENDGPYIEGNLILDKLLNLIEIGFDFIILSSINLVFFFFFFFASFVEQFTVYKLEKYTGQVQINVKTSMMENYYYLNHLNGY